MKTWAWKILAGFARFLLLQNQFSVIYQKWTWTQWRSFSHSFLFPNTSTHTSNGNITHRCGLQLRKQRVPVFDSKLYCYLKQHFDSTHSLSLSPVWFSLPLQLLLHTLEILHNHYLAKSRSLYSSLVPHILIWTFHSANIDKAREIESTQLSITTFPVLSMPLIFSLWMESHSHSSFCTWRSSISSAIALPLTIPLTVFMLFLIPSACSLHCGNRLRCCMQSFRSWRC